MKWLTLKNKFDLEKLPRNKYDILLSAHILVSSTKKMSENQVFLMYFDFSDNYFHFPSFNATWEDRPKLLPFTEINKWMPLPNKPKMER